VTLLAADAQRFRRVDPDLLHIRYRREDVLRKPSAFRGLRRSTGCNGDEDVCVYGRGGLVQPPVGEHQCAAREHAADLEAGEVIDVEWQQAQLLFDRNARTQRHAHQRCPDRIVGIIGLRLLRHLHGDQCRERAVGRHEHPFADALVLDLLMSDDEECFAERVRHIFACVEGEALLLQRLGRSRLLDVGIRSARQRHDHQRNTLVAILKAQERPARRHAWRWCKPDTRTRRIDDVGGGGGRSQQRDVERQLQRRQYRPAEQGHSGP
jgi:hypothetical protein